MRALFLGKHKRSAARALDWLAAQDCEIIGVVAAPGAEDAGPEQRLDLVAERQGIPAVEDADLYSDPPGDVDLVLSYLYPRKILPPLIDRARVACLNFHPAPLPDMRGVGGYNIAILEGRGDWGVSAHHVDESFDTGDLVAVERFAIDPERETAFSLDLRSQERLLALFRDVLGRVLAGAELPRTPQGEGRYVTRAELEALRRVRPGDDVARKLRAFWYPPWPGATIEVDGRELTLVDEALLADAARAYREAGEIP